MSITSDGLPKYLRTLALSLSSCMNGSLTDLPDAFLVVFMSSPRADATSLTALITMTCDSDWLEPRLWAPLLTASANWTCFFVCDEDSCMINFVEKNDGIVNWTYLL